MRLIDADHLRKWIINNWSTYQGTWNSVTIDAILDQIESEDIYFEDADIVDAAPIRHGHWIHDRLWNTNGGTYGVRRCSNCEYYCNDFGDEWNYCPDCGAKMDEVEK